MIREGEFPVRSGPISMRIGAGFRDRIGSLRSGFALGPAPVADGDLDRGAAWSPAFDPAGPGAGPDPARKPGKPGPAAPLYVRRVVAQARACSLRCVARSARPLDARTVVVISVVRDELPVLAEFLAHYRGLGAGRFVILDNGSSDGSTGFLAAQPDVDLYLVRPRLGGARKQGWINRVIAQYGYERWYVHADADEHLVFDGAGARSLGDLIGFAEARGLRRVRGMLVDMYGPGPVFAPPAPGGAPLAADFPLFDGDSYAETVCKQRIRRTGGPRKRTFSGGFEAELTKYPLFFIGAGEVFDHPHHLYPYPHNFASACYIAILHYKFNGTFPGKILDAVSRRNYFNYSMEYRIYLKALIEDRNLHLTYPGTRAYRDPADLLACGLIEPVAWSPIGSVGAGFRDVAPDRPSLRSTA